MQTNMLPGDHITAPDGSEIRGLVTGRAASMVHCRLPPGGVSLAVRHRSVEELWFFLSGRGKVWRRDGRREEVVAATPGLSLSIPIGAHFQFRNTGADPLAFVIATMPPWPGADEAVRVADHWPVG